MQDKIERLKNLPKKRIAACVLLFNEKDELLVLKPGYKDGWMMPGGVVEMGESLTDAAIREAKEEIGIDVKLSKCLAMDYSQYLMEGFLDECINIVFLGEKITSEEISKIKIDGEEVVDYKFVTIDEAVKILGNNLAKRVKAIKSSPEDFVFLEDGMSIFK